MIGTAKVVKGKVVPLQKFLFIGGVRNYLLNMKKTREEIRNMTEDEFWDYINRPNPRQINEDETPIHFNTKEEWRAYYSDGHEISEFMEIIKNEYGV